MAYAGEEKIEIGRILSRGFEILRQNLLLFAGIAFVVALLPMMIVTGVAALFLGGIGPAINNSSLASFTGFASSMLYWLAQSVIIYLSIRYFYGDLVSRKEAFSKVMSVFPRVIGASILVVLAFMLGLVLLVIPGIIIYIMFSVVVPVILNEDAGVMQGLRRSRELTKGSRWSIFLLLVVVTLIMGVGLAPLLAIAALFPDNPLALEFGGYLVNVVLIPITAVMTASLYIDLRLVREGAGTEDVGEIFA